MVRIAPDAVLRSKQRNLYGPSCVLTDTESGTACACRRIHVSSESQPHCTGFYVMCVHPSRGRSSPRNFRILKLCLARGVLLFIAGAYPASAGVPPYQVKFEQISLDQGLSQSSVRCILQDSRGFMWMGTEDGLNKYDGYSFKAYKPVPGDPHSISSNFIRCICEDRRGDLWIGTNGGGLNKLDRDSGSYTRFMHRPGDETSISNNYVWSVIEDRSGIFWIGTDGGGLNRYDPTSGIFTQYLFDPDDPGSLSDDAVLVVYEDRSGNLWIGTRNGGLNRFDRYTGRCTRYRSDPRDSTSLSADFVRAICEDAAGTLWIGTDGGGLNRYDRQNGLFYHYRHDPDDPGSLSDDRIWSIYTDRTGIVWIGTDVGGLNLFVPGDETFFSFRNDPNDPVSLSGNNVFSIYEDRLGVLWFGTEVGGVSKLDRDKGKFQHIRVDTGNPNSLNDNQVWSIYEDMNGILLIGTRSGGLNRLDRTTGLCTHYRSSPDDPSGLTSDHVRTIYEAPSQPGILWLGTDYGGLCRFDTARELFHCYRHDPDDPYSIGGNRVYSILEDRSGVLWVGTRTGGINILDRERGRFTRYRHDPDDPASISNDFVYKIYEDRLHGLWIGTFAGGLNRFDRENKRFVSYRADTNDPESLSSDCILVIHEDRDGTFWIGTGGGGLNRFDRESGRFRRYGNAEGLPNEVVYGILEDGNGNLWISTNGGISRFDPKTETFKSYTVQDGLQSNEFNGGAYFMSETGEMFFGGINGITAFYPEQIRDNPHIPPIVITSFRKLNREVTLPKPIADIDELALSHRDYVFSFEFAALDYTAPDKNQYAYMMEGLDESWMYTDASKRFANYTTLPPGTYTFRVKGSNNDGVWNEEGASVRIVISPPFWKSWWFRILVLAAAVAAFTVLYRRRLRNVRFAVELQAAHEAQMSIMPQSDPQLERFDISGICIPAHHVGGDFYDYMWLDDDKTKFGIAIGDVSGKAMDAAMIAVLSSGMIYSKADETSMPCEIMTRLNRSIFRKTHETMFTALCFAAIDTESRDFTFSVAGMNDPLLKSNGTVTRLEAAGAGFPLGIMRENTYEERTVGLNTGDVIVLFTDGITEARNGSKNFYGCESLVDILNGMDTASLSAGAIKERIITDVQRFAAGSKQHDDITLIVVKANS